MSRSTPDDFPVVRCPKCNRLLKAEGVICLGEAEVPVYQCDECICHRPFDGEIFEVSLTFVLNAQGEPVDPAEPDRVLRF